MPDLVINSRVTIPASEISWTAVRASGPGGQNVNKVASKVQLRFALARSEALPASVKRRLAQRAANQLDAEGNLVITAQQSRNQLTNLRRAREKLAELVRAALVPPRPRIATRPSRAAERARLATKRRISLKKQGRRAVDPDE
jgi:ribosome-associated protein